MDLKKFRLRYKLSTKDVIEEMSKAYPNYSKATNSIAEHPEKYGLQLVPKAVKRLKARFTPVRSGASGGSQSAPKKTPSRLSGAAVKLGTEPLKGLNFLMQRTGTKTEREMLEKIINEAYRKGE